MTVSILRIKVIQCRFACVAFRSLDWVLLSMWVTPEYPHRDVTLVTDLQIISYKNGGRIRLGSKIL